MSDEMRKVFDAWRSSKGWQRPDDPGEWEAWQAALSQRPVSADAPESLRERCKELIEWQKTGNLIGSALRSYAKAKWYAEEHNSLQMAEADTARPHDRGDDPAIHQGSEGEKGHADSVIPVKNQPNFWSAINFYPLKTLG